MQSIKKFTDEQLVRLFIDTQKNQYFEIIYDRYADKVYRKCLSFVRDEALAEDYTHDIFMKLILSLSSYKESAKFSTWLYSVTYNFCIDKIRQNKKMQEVPIEEDFDGVIDDSEEAEMAEMEAKRLNKAMEKISAEERTILMMKYQDDLSIKEISTSLNISESAVKMRLLRAKDKLKNLYLEQVIFWVVLIAKCVTWFKD